MDVGTGSHQVLKEFPIFPVDTFFELQRCHFNLTNLVKHVSNNILDIPVTLHLVSEEKGGHCIQVTPA
jgi:hypothetical protein